MWCITHRKQGRNGWLFSCSVWWLETGQYSLHSAIIQINFSLPLEFSSSSQANKCLKWMKELFLQASLLSHSQNIWAIVRMASLSLCWKTSCSYIPYPRFHLVWEISFSKLCDHQNLSIWVGTKFQLLIYHRKSLTILIDVLINQ